jgi:hypothetical protein
LIALDIKGLEFLLNNIETFPEALDLRQELKLLVGTLLPEEIAPAARMLEANGESLMSVQNRTGQVKQDTKIDTPPKAPSWTPPPPTP